VTLACLQILIGSHVCTAEQRFPVRAAELAGAHVSAAQRTISNVSAFQHANDLSRVVDRHPDTIGRVRTDPVRLPIAKIVNATVIPLDQAPKGYQDFDKGAAKKFVLDPNGLIKKAA